MPETDIYTTAYLKTEEDFASFVTEWHSYML